MVRDLGQRVCAINAWAKVTYLSTTRGGFGAFAHTKAAKNFLDVVLCAWV